MYPRPRQEQRITLRHGDGVNLGWHVLANDVVLEGLQQWLLDLGALVRMIHSISADGDAIGAYLAMMGRTGPVQREQANSQVISQ
eukprot:3050306-Amphidinium_carterae.2